MTQMTQTSRFILTLVVAGLLSTRLGGQSAAPLSAFVLQPDRVFVGETMLAGWVVVVRGDRIIAAGPRASARS